jgi:hypothetical protein
MINKPKCQFMVIGESFRFAFDEWLREQDVQLPEEYSQFIEKGEENGGT